MIGVRGSNSSKLKIRKRDFVTEVKKRSIRDKIITTLVYTIGHLISGTGFTYMFINRRVILMKDLNLNLVCL